MRGDFNVETQTLPITSLLSPSLEPPITEEQRSSIGEQGAGRHRSL